MRGHCILLSHERDIAWRIAMFVYRYTFIFKSATQNLNKAIYLIVRPINLVSVLMMDDPLLFSMF